MRSRGEWCERRSGRLWVAYAPGLLPAQRAGRPLLARWRSGAPPLALLRLLRAIIASPCGQRRLQLDEGAVVAVIQHLGLDHAVGLAHAVGRHGSGRACGNGNAAKQRNCSRASGAGVPGPWQRVQLQSCVSHAVSRPRAPRHTRSLVKHTRSCYVATQSSYIPRTLQLKRRERCRWAEPHWECAVSMPCDWRRCTSHAAFRPPHHFSNVCARGRKPLVHSKHGMGQALNLPSPVCQHSSRREEEVNAVQAQMHCIPGAVHMTSYNVCEASCCLHCTRLQPGAGPGAWQPGVGWLHRHKSTAWVCACCGVCNGQAVPFA